MSYQSPFLSKPIKSFLYTTDGWANEFGIKNIGVTKIRRIKMDIENPCNLDQGGR